MRCRIGSRNGVATPIASLVFLCVLASSASSQNEPANPANKFVLDYNVPESPAFTVLGVTPANVVRGTASKPVVASLLSTSGTSVHLLAGAALDVAPYAFVGRFRNVEEYQKTAWKRVLANTLVSFATVPASTDTTSVRFGAGIRVTLSDPRDLLQDSSLTRDISRRLVPTHVGGGEGTNIPGMAVTTGDTVDLKDAYKAARKRLESKRGLAAALGFGYGATLLGSVISGDSLSSEIWRGWFAGTYYLGKTNEILGTVQYVRNSSEKSNVNLGLALRLHAEHSSVAAELAFDGKTRKLLPGFNAELSLAERISALVSLVNEVAAGEGTPHLRLKTSFKWAAANGY
jgi:hypothetical protein